MTAAETAAWLAQVERNAEKAYHPACPRCNGVSIRLGWIADAAVFSCKRCGHRFEQLALFPMPATAPAPLTLTPTPGPQPVQKLFDFGPDLETDLQPDTNGQEE